MIMKYCHYKMCIATSYVAKILLNFAYRLSPVPVTMYNLVTTNFVFLLGSNKKKTTLCPCTRTGSICTICIQLPTSFQSSRNTIPVPTSTPFERYTPSEHFELEQQSIALSKKMRVILCIQMRKQKALEQISSHVFARQVNPHPTPSAVRPFLTFRQALQRNPNPSPFRSLDDLSKFERQPEPKISVKICSKPLIFRKYKVSGMFVRKAPQQKSSRAVHNTNMKPPTPPTCVTTPPVAPLDRIYYWQVNHQPFIPTVSIPTAAVLQTVQSVIDPIPIVTSPIVPIITLPTQRHPKRKLASIPEEQTF